MAWNDWTRTQHAYSDRNHWKDDAIHPCIQVISTLSLGRVLVSDWSLIQSAPKHVAMEQRTARLRQDSRKEEPI